MAFCLAVLRPVAFWPHTCIRPCGLHVDVGVCVCYCRILYVFGMKSDSILSVQAAAGVEFNDGVSKDDFNIVIESANCAIESFTANRIDCRPPVWAPTVDQRFRYKNLSTLDCHRHHSFHVQVNTVAFH